MSPQAVTSKMIHRAEVERDQASGTDDWNNTPVPDFQPLLTVRCFAWSRVRREIVDEDKTAVAEDMRAIMPLGTDITEKDRIAVIKDRAGSILYAGPLRIEAVQRHLTHLELTLQRFNG